ncbi:NfeD family protein [Chloroflexota bacterium]
MCKEDQPKLIRRTIADWGKVLVLLLDEAAVVVLVILVLRYFRIQIPLPMALSIAIVVGAVVFIIHIAVIPSFRRKQVAGREGMIGEQGRVVEPLTPFGTIIIKGEYWKAKSLDDTIEFDENVEVVGSERLTLEVKRKGS